MSAPIEKVCLVGANGSLGSVILDALLAAGTFSVSILQRSTSTTPTPAGGITLIPFDPAFDVPELTRLLAGQDAVVAAFPVVDVGQHLRLAEAACAAGVRRYLPADFGSCDARSAQAQHHLQLYRDKAAVQALCETLAAAGRAPFSWTSVVCGHFFDWGLRNNYLQLDVAAGRALVLDAGVTRASASTLARVGAAVVRVLQRPAATRNRVVMVQSFCATPLEVVAALERATGRAWHTAHADSNAFLDRETARLAAGHADALHNIVFVLGAVDADWTRRDEFAMDELGLQDEDLDVVVGDVVRELRAKGLA
ncbi:family transcriptional regulator [Cordyceps militaris]|uniref:Family transcriptional regulator n=1 Tax=Cordyceps militaris TaxID=73501 RepID=A0A2H4SNM7_CORMI|nr:family transcriptional regulator [Cordyceps militaris]